MEIKIPSKYIWAALQILTWIIFLGLCVEAGCYLFNTIFALFVNPESTLNYWDKANMAPLYYFNQSHFVAMTAVMIIVAILKAILFYLILKIFYDKSINLTTPFTTELQSFLTKLGYLAFGIGLFANCGQDFALWLSEQGVAMPSMEGMNVDGSDVWLFMAVILFVIVRIIKKGVSLQSENDLTI